MRTNRIMAWWDTWRENHDPPYGHRNNQLLPLTSATRPGPIFCDYMDTGITQDMLNEETIVSIGEWSHVVNFLFSSPDLAPHVVRPPAHTAIFMMVHFLRTDHAHRLMPWIWSELPVNGNVRYLVRNGWNLYVRNNMMTVHEEISAEAELLMIEFELQKRLAPAQRTTLTAQRNELRTKMNGPTPLDCIKDNFKLGEVVAPYIKEANPAQATAEALLAECADIYDTAVDLAAPPRRKATQSSPTASVRAQRSRKQAQSRRAK